MKRLFTLLFLISNLTLLAQSNIVVGDYVLVLGNDDSRFDYKLTLRQDGTFTFDYYSLIKMGIPQEKTKYGKGSWTIENNVITFLSEKEKDFDEKYTLDFTTSKARFITKSPRDKTNRIVKTRIQFLTSEIEWMARIELLKL
ncbi:hypothetical protein [Flavobacterium sp.]